MRVFGRLSQSAGELQVASFGARLKQVREQRGVSLDDVAQSTKIGTRMLRALEQEQLDQLPGGIFNKGFIRAYARFLGIDEEEVIAEYAAATGTVPAAQKAEEERFPLQDVKAEIEKEQSGGLPWGMLAAFLVIAALLFAIWGVYSRTKQNQAEKPPAPTAAPAQAQAQNDASLTAKPPATQAQTVSSESHPPAIASSQGKPAGETKATLTPPPSVVVPKVPAVSSNAPATAGAIRVTVKAREDSWVSITVDGEVTVRGTLAAGSQRNIRGSREIAIKAGNAGALDFAFNGKDLPSQGAEGEVKSLVFDANGLQPAAASPEPPAQQP